MKQLSAHFDVFERLRHWRVIFGALVKPALQTIQDLNAREVAILAPLVVITILLGVYPKPVFDVTTPAVAKLINDNKTALALEHASGAFARAKATKNEVAVVQKAVGP